VIENFFLFAIEKDQRLSIFQEEKNAESMTKTLTEEGNHQGRSDIGGREKAPKGKKEEISADPRMSPIGALQTRHREGRTPVPGIKEISARRTRGGEERLPAIRMASFSMQESGLRERKGTKSMVERADIPDRRLPTNSRERGEESVVKRKTAGRRHRRKSATAVTSRGENRPVSPSS